MSSRDRVLRTLRKLCGRRRLPTVSVLDAVVGRLWCNKLVWKGPVDEDMATDYITHFERNGTMVGVFFRRHSTVIFFCEAIAAQLPVGNFGDDYSVRLRYISSGLKMDGCLLHVTEMGPEEMVFETVAGMTMSVMDAIAN